MDYSNIKHTVHISSHIGKGCEVCGKTLGGMQHIEIASQINHYLQEHDYRLLHVGSELLESQPVMHATVAVVGSIEIPPPRPPLAVNIRTFADDSDKS